MAIFILFYIHSLDEIVGVYRTLEAAKQGAQLVNPAVEWDTEFDDYGRLDSLEDEFHIAHLKLDDSPRYWVDDTVTIYAKSNIYRVELKKWNVYDEVCFDIPVREIGRFIGGLIRNSFNEETSSLYKYKKDYWRSFRRDQLITYDRELEREPA